MSCDLTDRRGANGTCRGMRSGRRGLTLVELMVVAAIVIIFSTAAITAFIQLIQASDAVDARLDALSNARAFLQTFSYDLRRASTHGAIPRSELFIGTNTSRGFGDLVDDDGDGIYDEEVPDGLDAEPVPDWIRERDDRDHRRILSGAGPGGPPIIDLKESGWGEPDLGDAHVDEDVVFNSDTLTFWVRGPFGSNFLRQQITYAIEPFEGEQNVLVKRIRTIYNDGTPEQTEVSPLAFNVLSVNFLYWDSSATPPYWRETWDSGALAPGEIPAPVSVYAKITIYAGTAPLKLPPTRELETVSLETMVNIEAVLSNPSYRATLAEAQRTRMAAK